jgi:ACS family glucarate transporter-like MFS transporter
VGRPQLGRGACWRGIVRRVVAVHRAHRRVATGLTISLVLVRFLFGAAEAGAFPNAAKVMKNWFPASERGRVQGIMLAFAQIGAVAAPAAAAYLIDVSGWRVSFFIFGALGVVWAIGFWFWFRDDPAAHGSVNEAEVAIIHEGAGSEPEKADPGPVPWGEVLTNRGIITLSVLMILSAFFTYFFYTWFPTFLQDGCGVTNKEAGNMTSLVNGGSAVGMLIGGWLADRMSKLADPMRARRYLGVVAYLAASGCMFAGSSCEDALSLTLFFTGAFCTMHCALPNWWSVVIPQSGKHVATLFGLMNGIGVMGALVSHLVRWPVR